ncbi:MAG: glycosyltransferase, partial [bacterium]|nr:glycosyltransferase [bacterium]
MASHPPAAGLLGKVLRSSPGLKSELAADAIAGDVLHTHGLWLMPNVYPAWAMNRSNGGARLLHSPRGMLGNEALKISAWKKRPVWWLAQHSAIRRADCLHATAMSEYEEMRAVELDQPVAVIPNGIDLPELDGFPRADNAARVVLSLGRIHPKKGLDRLVRAWAGVERDHPEWRLRIVGPAELGYDERLQKLAVSLGIQRVSVEPPVYGAEKLSAYRSADLFVLPTLNENFAMTVAEALAAEVPVISSSGAPWSGLESKRCGWWIDHGAEPLAAALGNAMAMPRDDLHAMGARGRMWMAQDFAWDQIGRDMLDVYRWLRQGGEPPPTVRVD